jgi:hypothetical protein
MIALLTLIHTLMMLAAHGYTLTPWHGTGPLVWCRLTTVAGQVYANGCVTLS